MNKLIYALSAIMAILTNLTIAFFKYKTQLTDSNDLIRDIAVKGLKNEIFSWGALIVTLILTIIYICFFLCLNLIINKDNPEENSDKEQTP